MLDEAKKFWDSISGRIKGLIQDETKSALRLERYDVTTAPNGTKMGVTKPFGSTELMLPYSTEVANAKVGDPVLVGWWGSMSNARVYYFAKGYNGSGYSIYRSVTELGFTSGAAATTINAVYSAMPGYSILICIAAEFYSTEVPTTGGTVEIVKRGAARGWATLYGKRITDTDYRLYFVGDDFSSANGWVPISQKNITSGSANLNDYTTPGLYWFSSGTTLSNAPNSAADGYLEVLKTTYTATYKQYWHRSGSYNPSSPLTGSYQDEYFRFYGSYNGVSSWSPWVKIAVDVDYKIYNAVTDLNLTSGSATISGAWSAMPDNSILICTASNFASGETPVTGTVEIIKRGSTYGIINCYSAVSSDHNDYRMYVDSGTLTGTWVKKITTLDAASATPKAPASTAAVGTSTAYARADHVHPNPTIIYESKNVSTASLAAGSAYDYTLNVAKSGYTPLAVAGYYCTGTNSSLQLVYRCYVDGNTVHMSVRNTASSAYTGTRGVYILYMKN